MSKLSFDHSHPLFTELAQLQAVLTNTNRMVQARKGQFNLIPDNLVDAVNAVHTLLDGDEDKVRVQKNLVRYAECTLNDMVHGH